jgi:hypothetical protein
MGHFLRVRYWLPFCLLLSIVAVFAFIRHQLNRRKEQQREARYQSTVRVYHTALKPGMNRREVEAYLKAQNATFRHMCCVERKDFSTGVYDDLAKIDQLEAPWFCNENNVYVALEFTGKPRHVPDAEPEDTLREVTIYRWLEGCL